MIITIGGTKGGPGKSTVTQNIAAELARQEIRCVIVDADRTATSTNWAADRKERSPEFPHITVTSLSGAIRPDLIDLEKAYEVVLVDVGGHDSQEFRQAAVTSDLLIAPVTTAQAELDSLKKVVKLVAEFRDFNPELQARSLFNKVPSNDDRLKSARAHIVDQYPEIPAFDGRLRYRLAYQDAMSMGRGVTEWTDSTAKGELQVLVKEIFDGQA